MLDYATLPSQRQDLIKQILISQGRVLCSDIAQQLGVSEHTIRRDLHELSREGVCKKVYGGAILQISDSATYDSRKEQNVSIKDKIGQKCASLVSSGNCIFIDVGSTNLAMARSLPLDMEITVVTNSPDIASTLMNHPCIEIIMLGGRIQKDSGGSVGSIAAGQLKNIIIDQAFMGGCAMSVEAGLTGFDFDDCEFKKLAVSQSSQVIVGLTLEKIPRIARFNIASCESIDMLVVQDCPEPSFYSPFEDENITISKV